MIEQITGRVRVRFKSGEIGPTSRNLPVPASLDTAGTAPAAPQARAANRFAYWGVRVILWRAYTCPAPQSLTHRISYSPGCSGSPLRTEVFSVPWSR